MDYFLGFFWFFGGGGEGGAEGTRPPLKVGFSTPRMTLPFLGCFD